MERNQALAFFSMTRMAQIACALVAWMALPPLALSQAPVCPGGHMLELRVVLGLIQDNVGDETVTRNRIQACHVSFNLDVTALEQLTTANAPKEILDALNKDIGPRLTPAEAHVQVSALQQHVADLSQADAANLNAALKKLDADYQPQRDKAAQISPKGPYESTAEYMERKRQSDAMLSAMDRKHESDANAVRAQFTVQANIRNQVFTAQIAYLESASYTDSAKARFTDYNPDSQQLNVMIGDEGYRFNNVPGTTARRLNENWSSVTVTRPYTEDRMKSRTLHFGTEIAIEGRSMTAFRGAEIEQNLNAAKVRAAQRDYEGASQLYLKILDLEPGNEAAAAGLASIKAIQQKRSEFLKGLEPGGAWLDPHSSLIWTIHDSDEKMTWELAKGYCQSLTTAGLSGWRLPSMNDFKGISDYKTTVAKYRIKGPIELRNNNLWTSQSHPGTYGGTVRWYFESTHGLFSESFFPNDKYHALCVRPYRPATDGFDASSTTGQR